MSSDARLHAVRTCVLCKGTLGSCGANDPDLGQFLIDAFAAGDPIAPRIGAPRTIGLGHRTGCQRANEGRIHEH